MRRLQYPGAILVACLWTLAFVDGILTQRFEPLEVMTPIVMIAAGAIFTAKNGRP